jgi:hypothetical protein
LFALVWLAVCLASGIAGAITSELGVVSLRIDLAGGKKEGENTQEFLGFVV